MGRYYGAVSIDKKEYLERYDYGNGAKLMEHSYIGNFFVEAVVSRLEEGRAWANTRIVWAGDYGDEFKFLEGFEKEIAITQIETKENNSYYEKYNVDDIDVNLYRLADCCFKKIVPEKKREKEYEDHELIRYFYNHDLKQ